MFKEHQPLLAMAPNIAYLSEGKLYLKQNDSPLCEIQSEFGISVQTRKLEMKRRKAWKNRGIMEMMLPPGALAQMDQQPEPSESASMTSICREEEGKLLYSLEAGELGGIFAWDLTRDREERIFHNTEFGVGALDYHPDQKLIACTTTYRNGIINIAVMPRDSSRPRDVTEGDSLDLAPRWIRGQKKALVYQSAGLGRTNNGYISDRAPFTIEKLDFDKQEVISLASDPKSDLLGPQIASDGQLYYISRPYQSRKPSLNFFKFLKEVLLVPFRLLHALFQWLNFFTQMHTGKPLMRAGTNQTVEPKQLRVWGDWITPELIRDRNFSEPDAPSLVPKSWQLRRQGLQGDPEVLAEGILSYDLAADGTIVYTNGSAIYAIYPDGKRERIWRGNLIEAVVVMNSAAES